MLDGAGIKGPRGRRLNAIDSKKMPSPFTARGASRHQTISPNRQLQKHPQGQNKTVVRFPVAVLSILCVGSATRFKTARIHQPPSARRGRRRPALLWGKGVPKTILGTSGRLSAVQLLSARRYGSRIISAIRPYAGGGFGITWGHIFRSLKGGGHVAKILGHAQFGSIDAGRNHGSAWPLDSFPASAMRGPLAGNARKQDVNWGSLQSLLCQ